MVTLDPVAKPLDHLTLRGEAGAPALVLRDRVLDFAELDRRVGQIAAWLGQCVSVKGSRVASWAAKGEMTCLLPLAAARAGLVHVPINPLLKRAQAAHILADCGASLLIGTEARIASMEDGDVPPTCRVLGEKAALAEVDDLSGYLGPAAAAPDDLAAILYTSGSTGSKWPFKTFATVGKPAIIIFIPATSRSKKAS